MTPDQLQEMLKQTLEDRKLSRGEKRALSAVFSDLVPNDQELNLYRHAAFDLARESLNNVAARQVINWLEDVLKVFQGSSETREPSRAECHFSPGDDCPRRIAGLFAATKRAADVCVFTITDNRISQAILAAHQRGVVVRVITDNEKAADLGSDVSELERAGVKVRVDRSPYHMHHKFATFDGELLLTGSYNWTRGAAESNEENFIVSDDRRLLEPFGELFERLWKAFA